MPRSDDRIRIEHTIRYATEAMETARGRCREDLAQDRLFELALTRLVELVGEAAAHVSAEARGVFPQVPWVDIIGMRNRLIHAYDSVDLDVLWDVVLHDLPVLVAALRADRDEPGPRQ